MLTAGVNKLQYHKLHSVKHTESLLRTNIKYMNRLGTQKRSTSNSRKRKTSSHKKEENKLLRTDEICDLMKEQIILRNEAEYMMLNKKM